MSEIEEFEFRARLNNEIGKSPDVESGVPPISSPVTPSMEAPFAAQVGRGMLDVYQGSKQAALHAGNYFGVVDDKVVDDYDKELGDEIDFYNKLNPDIQLGRIAGNIATPLSLIPAASSARGMAATGALFSSLQPVTEGDYAEEKLLQAGTGAVLSPIIGKLIPKASKKGIDLFAKLKRPFSKKGMTEDMKELFVDAIGEQRAEVAEALSKAAPKLTAGQILAEASLVGDDIGAGIVRLEKDLSRQAGAGIPLRKLYNQQQKVREGLLQNISKTDIDREAAVQARKSITDPLYAIVEESTEAVNAAPVLRELTDLINSNVNRSKVVVPLKRIKRKLLDSSDDNFQGKVASLHSLSKDIKDMMQSKSPGGVDQFDVKALSMIKKSLDSQLNKAESAFTKAQSEFQKRSIPINRMDVGKALEDKLFKPAGVESPGMYLKAISDATTILKKSTGFSRYKTLDQIMNPEQMKAINSVGKELERSLKSRKIGESVQGVLTRLSPAEKISLPHVLSRPVVITNAILKRIGVDKTDAYNKVATELLLNPKKLATLLKEPATSSKGAIARSIYQDIAQKLAPQSVGRQSGE